MARIGRTPSMTGIACMIVGLEAAGVEHAAPVGVAGVPLGRGRPNRSASSLTTTGEAVKTARLHALRPWGAEVLRSSSPHRRDGPVDPSARVADPPGFAGHPYPLDAPKTR